MTDIDLVVLDMVGTTIENGDQVFHAFRTSLEESGVSVTEDEIVNFMGASKRAVISHFVQRSYGGGADASEVDELVYSRFNQALRKYYSDGGVRPVARVEKTFEWLRLRGIKIALTTGFERRVADDILEAVGWDEKIIDASVCSDEVSQGRPAPFLIFHAMEQTKVDSVDRVMVVGDTSLDLQAACNAGVRSVVGVLTGSHDFAILGETKHTHILPSVADLPRLIEAGPRNDG